MNAVDTNVLLYVHDPRDPVKQDIAARLVRSLTDAVLLWQVACEYLAASRKLEPYGYSLSKAFEDLRDLHRIWPTCLPGWGVVDRAEDLLRRCSLSFWDAMIIAQCLEANVEELYSEDLGVHPLVDRLRITNPFVHSAA